MIRILLPLALLLPAALPAAAPPARRAAAVRLVEKTALIDYAYRWPAQAAAIPRLDARLRADARTRRQQALNGARQDRDARKGESFPFNGHSAVKEWKVAGDTGGLLVLRGDFYEYTGGAHGMSGFESILWDRRGNRNIPLWSLFRDPAAARAELSRLFCPALDAERERKRGEPVVRTGKDDDWLNGCPDLAKQVLVPTGVKAGRFTHIMALIAPYEAGPYAEGSYEVPLPVTRRLAGLAKPEWRRLF